MNLHSSPALTALFGHVKKFGLTDSATLERILTGFFGAYADRLVIGPLTDHGITIGDEIEVHKPDADRTRRGVVLANIHVDGEARHVYFNGQSVYQVDAVNGTKSLTAHRIVVVLPLAERQKGRAV